MNGIIQYTVYIFCAWVQSSAVLLHQALLKLRNLSALLPFLTPLEIRKLRFREVK